MEKLILAINPGSTSTKIGVFCDDKQVLIKTIDHQREELARFNKVVDQDQMRYNYIINILTEAGFSLDDFSAVVGRGGLLKPITGGTYAINGKMLTTLKSGKYGNHASNLGAILAYEIAHQADCPAYIVDPVVVDELASHVRITGLPELEHKSIFHALNQKAVARKYAEKVGCEYQDLNLIVAHLGGGISVALHRQGQVVDVNDALGGNGPFSPNRAGSVPVKDVVALAYSEKYTKDQLIKKLVGEGGLLAYLGTTDLREVEAQIESGDKKAKLIFKAMAYQISKEIGSLTAAANGNIDAVILTGGMAYSDKLTASISKRVSFIAPVSIYPGEEELSALAAGALRVLRKEEKSLEYE